MPAAPCRHGLGTLHHELRAAPPPCCFAAANALPPPRPTALLQGMADRGPWPDVVSFNTLIAAAAAGGNVRLAMRIFSDMVDAGAALGVSCWLFLHELAQCCMLHAMSWVGLRSHALLRSPSRGGAHGADVWRAAQLLCQGPRCRIRPQGGCCASADRKAASALLLGRGHVQAGAGLPHAQACHAPARRQAGVLGSPANRATSLDNTAGRPLARSLPHLRRCLIP